MTTRPDPEILPILPSLDLAETHAFYGGQLGFDQTVYADDAYLIVRRDPIELHFWKTDDRSLCERTAVYIRGGAVDALHAEFAARGVQRLSAFTVRPWDMKEFTIHDPHGNLLRFGRIPLEGES